MLMNMPENDQKTITCGMSDLSGIPALAVAIDECPHHHHHAGQHKCYYDEGDDDEITCMGPLVEIGAEGHAVSILQVLKRAIAAETAAGRPIGRHHRSCVSQVLAA